MPSKQVSKKIENATIDLDPSTNSYDEVYTLKDPIYDEDEENKNVTEVGKTKFGKKILVVKNPGNRGYFIKFQNGGQLPRQLEGLWTDFVRAENAVKLYMAGKNDDAPFESD